MQKTKLIAQLLASAMLSSIWVTLGGQIVHAGSKPLAEMRCVGSGPGRWDDKTIDVAIGRAVYTSSMYLNPSNGSASVTCRIRDEGDRRQYFKNLELGLGILDSDRGTPPVTVEVFLNGQSQGRQTISPGQTTTFNLTVTDINNVAIEARCSTRADYCGRVYVVRDRLERIQD